MICYKDMTFCTYYTTCKSAKECPRCLTQEVKDKADKIGLRICMFAEKPDCYNICY